MQGTTPAPRAETVVDDSEPDIPRTLVVANKFAPTIGGIQTFTRFLAAELPPDRLVIVAPPGRGGATADVDADKQLPFQVIRDPRISPRHPGVGRALAAVARAEGCQAAWFPEGTPLGVVAPAVRRGGVEHVVASTHGHEVGWSYVPGGAFVVRTVARSSDVLTFLTDVTLRRLRAVVPSDTRLERLTGGVDPTRFHPGAGGDVIRRRLGLVDRPVVTCVARLVTRKGQDMLIQGWPTVLRGHPDAVLMLVGAGPAADRLRRLAAQVGVEASVVFTGRIPDEELPAHLDASDVFAMPSRARLHGLEIEGLGLSALEASASGLPVITGAAGGAPEVVLPGRTGLVVDGRDHNAVAGAVVGLLDDGEARAAMGAAGREWMCERWTWAHLSRRLARLLAGQRPSEPSDPTATPEHATPEHQTADHQTSEHQTPEHQTPEQQTARLTAARHQVAATAEPDADATAPGEAAR
jgi:phosphatidyl-myo-inositol dimannoside synthase